LVESASTNKAFVEVLGIHLPLIKKLEANVTNYNTLQIELKTGANSTFGKEIFPKVNI
jgi:hypothetical protein